MAGLQIHEITQGTFQPTQELTQVVARPVDTFVSPELADATKLAQSLQDFMPVAKQLQESASKRDQEVGKLGAEQGKSREEMVGYQQQVGYDSHKGYLEGEAAGKQLQADWANAPKVDADGNTIPFEQFYKTWSAANLNSQQQQSEFYLTKFNTAFGQSLAATKGASIEFAAKQNLAKNQAMTVTSAYSHLKEILGRTDPGTPFNTQTLDALIKAQVADPLSAGFTPQQVESMVYSAAVQIGNETGDTRIQQAFSDRTHMVPTSIGNMAHGDGTFQDKIHADIIAAGNAAFHSMQQQAAMKELARETERSNLIHKFFPDIGKASPADLQAFGYQMFNLGYYKTPAEMNTEIGALTAAVKRAETPAQNLKALQLQLDADAGKFKDPAKLLTMVATGDLAFEGAEKVRSAIQARSSLDRQLAHEDARAAKQGELTQSQLLEGAVGSITKIPNPYPKYINGNPLLGENPVWTQREALKYALEHEFRARLAPGLAPSEYQSAVDRLIQQHEKDLNGFQLNLPDKMGEYALH